MTPEKWARLRAKTNDQVLAEARADSAALPVEDRKPRLGRVARVSLAKRIRWALHMSQIEFAKTFRIPLGTALRMHLLSSAVCVQPVRRSGALRAASW
jgi:DNA-binding transcriptional regulator YiaG